MSVRKAHLNTLAISLLRGCCLLWGLQQVLIKATIAEIPSMLHGFPVPAGGDSSALAVMLVATDCAV
ncbi:MAG: hypothetical protein ABIV07_08745 [Polaromonas sp.]